MESKWDLRFRLKIRIVSLIINLGLIVWWYSITTTEPILVKLIIILMIYFMMDDTVKILGIRKKLKKYESTKDQNR